MTATSAAAAPAAATAIVISITLSTSSPTLQLSASDSEDPFYLLTTATITSCPDPDSDSPVTLHTGRFPAAVTALAAFPPDSGRTGLAAASPALQGHAIGDLVCRRGGGGGAEKRVQWDWARTNWVPPRNLREDRDLTWATVPAQGRGALVVRHYLPREKLRECGVVPGEVYRTGLDGAVAGACPMWWTWGDLSTDLKDKKFGYEGVKDGKGGIIHEGPEWAVDQSRRSGLKLRLEHSDEAVRIEIV